MCSTSHQNQGDVRFALACIELEAFKFLGLVIVWAGVAGRLDDTRGPLIFSIFKFDNSRYDNSNGQAFSGTFAPRLYKGYNHCRAPGPTQAKI